MTESQLVNACLELLAYKGLFARRNNSGSFKTEKGFYRFGAKGSGDIILVYQGYHIEIECKVGKNKQTPSQKAYQTELESAGGTYWVVYSIEELQEHLKYGLSHL